MNSVSAICFFLFIVVFVLTKNYKCQLVLIILSLIGNMFYFELIGSRVLLYQMTALMAIPHYISGNFSSLNKLIRGIKLEYFVLIILGLLFGFIFPWEDNSSMRSWSQLAGGRAFVALVRIIIELLLVYYIYHIFKTGKVSQLFLLKLIAIILIFLSLFAMIDLVLNHQIWKLIFSKSAYNSILDNRFLGWSHEPRSFGRLILIPWFILLIYRQNGFYIRNSKLALLLGFISIISSLSFSTYIIFFIGIIILALSRFSLKKVQNGLTTLIIGGFFIFSAYKIVSKTDYFQSGLVYRFIMLTEGRIDFQMRGEPFIFTSFEVFDRAALNFFYNNINYIYFGTGPNLISIPSSKYLDKSASITFNDTLVGIPGVGIINHISRSGVIGLLLYLLSFVKVNRYIKKSDNKVLKEVFAVITVTYLIVGNPWIYFAIGYVVAQSELTLNKKI